MKNVAPGAWNRQRRLQMFKSVSANSRCQQENSIGAPTCSLVVRPRATSTMWNPVSPMTGMKKSPATHITTSLDAKGQA